MKLIFDEHFYNLDNWNFEKGFVRNQELQYYTDRNIELTESGLKIYGRKELVKNESYDNVSSDWTKCREYAEYTSSSINTKNKFSFKYGVLEVKAKIPIQDGAWPAIWLMGEDEEWPYCDEVDVMEYYLCDNTPTILANFMWSNAGEINWSTKQVSFDYFKTVDKEWENKFHVWKFDWTDNYMKIYIDDELINILNISNFKSNKFKKDYYILLNLAIGRKNLKPKENDLPLVYEIEYVKVYSYEDDM